MTIWCCVCAVQFFLLFSFVGCFRRFSIAYYSTRQLCIIWHLGQHLFDFNNFLCRSSGRCSCFLEKSRLLHRSNLSKLSIFIGQGIILSCSLSKNACSTVFLSSSGYQLSFTHKCAVQLKKPDYLTIKVSAYMLTPVVLIAPKLLYSTALLHRRCYFRSSFIFHNSFGVFNCISYRKTLRNERVQRVQLRQ